jgi:Flp pilus assembly pilin Flp
MFDRLNSVALDLYTRTRIEREGGQALVEYALIVALISIVAVAVLTNIGSDIVKKLEIFEGGKTVLGPVENHL